NRNTRAAFIHQIRRQEPARSHDAQGFAAVADARGVRGPGRSVSGTRPWAWILFGVIATVGVIVLLTPGVRPGFRPRVTHLRGPETLAYGTHVMLTGRTARAPGQVTVLGRWNNGPWHFLAIENAGDRAYRFGIVIDHHGRLDLRVVQPNGDYSW